MYSDSGRESQDGTRTVVTRRKSMFIVKIKSPAALGCIRAD